MRNRSKIIGDAPCPQCRKHGRDRTGNHLILFEDGGAYCNRCSYTESTPLTKNVSRHAEGDSTPGLQPGKGSSVPSTTNKKNHMNMPTVQDVLSYMPRALPERGLTFDTVNHFGVRVHVDETSGEPTQHFYPLTSKGRVVRFKVRDVQSKSFSTLGPTTQCDLFGQSEARAGKTLFVTEGELDALSVYQALVTHSSLQDYSPAVVSVPHGAASAAKALSENSEFVNSYEKVVFVFDQDDAGAAGLKAACQCVPGKSYYVDLPYKDPNEMLMAGKSEDLKWLLMKPKLYQPDNIVNVADAWEMYKESSNIVSYPYPREWTELNKKTYGVRPGSVITVASGSGCGKTQFLRELKYHYHTTTDWKQGDISLEESISDSMAGLMALHLNKRIQLPDVQVTKDEERQAFDYLFSDGRWSMYDHFGGMDDENLFTKLRYLAATGHKVIYLDHLSIIVSEYASEGGERERIDTIMTRLAKMAKEFGLIIFLVVHLKKSSGFDRPFEEGAKPSLDDLRGSGSIKQLSWDVLFLTRNQQHPDEYCANTSLITVGKCRFTGRTGDADYLNFSDTTGRMSRVAEPFGWSNTK